MRYVFVDIDHTLAHSAWRDHLAPMKDPRGPADKSHLNWDNYNLASVADEPVREVCDLVVALQLTGKLVIGLTSRPERWREITEEWLRKAGLDLEAILMRPDHETTPAAVLKPGLVAEYLGTYVKARNHVALVLDDREDVCRAFEALGVTVLQVRAARR